MSDTSNKFNIIEYDNLFNQFNKTMNQLSWSRHPLTGKSVFPVYSKELALSGDRLARKYKTEQNCCTPRSHDAITLSEYKNDYKLNLIEFKFTNKNNSKPSSVIKTTREKFIGTKTILDHYNIWYPNYLVLHVFKINSISPRAYLEANRLVIKIEKLAKDKMADINFMCLTIKTFEKKINDFKNYKKIDKI